MAQETPAPAPSRIGPQPTTVVPHHEHPPGSIPAGLDRTNTMAIVSLTAGALSFLVLPLIGAIVAIVTGHYARAEIKGTGQAGDGLALAGIVIGFVHLVVLVVMTVLGLLLWLGLLTLWFLPL